MRNKIKFNRVAMAVAMSVGLSTAAFAQETSSSIRGEIVGPQGNAAANTTITITHIPTGTKKTVVTNSQGEFLAKGLRVGGPYKVLVDSDTFNDAEISDVFLSLGETRRITQQLQNEDIESIQVVGTRVLFNSKGSESFFGSEDITSAPTLTRDIKDVVRGNPLVNISPGTDRQISIAGSNPRFNSITIDGIPLNDDFGLNSGGFPTQRNPFPLDALDQVSVEIAPVHAKTSGFQGGLINANFKSGTNEFHGNAFYEYQDDGLAGDPRDDGLDIDLDFEEKNYGFTVGGPILKDKLFFFAAYENFEAPQQLDFGAAGSGIGSNSTTATVNDVAAVKEIASRVYNQSEIGEFNTQPLVEDEKYLVKLDWNISDDHRAEFLYMFNDGNRTRNTSSSARELRLSTHWYNNTQELKNTSLKLYSDWSDSFSTEISLTSKSVETGQVSFNSELGLGDITINNIDVDGDGNRGSIAFGSDQFRHSNSLSNDVAIFKFDGTYLFDEHALDFGFDVQQLSVENQFLPNSRGTITFNSLEDFENRQASRYSYENGVGNDPLAVAAVFDRLQTSAYVNDTWDFSDDLTLSFGLRYERYSSDDAPVLNQSVLDRTGFRNDFVLDGADIFLPRAGFTYLINDDITLRGSLGRYSGGNPNVWISNSFSNDGVSKLGLSGRNLAVPANILTNPLPAAVDAVASGTGNSTSNLVDPNFELPSEWRYMLNTDVTIDIPGIGEDVAWTSTAIFAEKKDSPEWINAALLQEGDVVGSTLSGALPFYDTRELEIMLTNADKNGRSVILSTGLSKEWDNGFSADISYTNQDITDGNPGTSSTARSNYRFGHFLDHQKTQLGTSGFQVEHRFAFNLGYKAELVEGYQTRVNLFVERRSGNPYSLLGDLNNLQGGRFFNQDLVQPSGFGSTFGGNYLAYVPTANDPNVVYTGASEAEVLAFFDERGLSGYAGRHLDKNTQTAPWITRSDLFISQEIAGLMDGHKGELYMVVQNVFNLLDVFNSSSGRVRTQNFATREVLELDINEDTGQYIYGDFVQDPFNFEAEESTWRIKVGVKYNF